MKTSTRLKSFLPGYRARWRHRYAVLLAELAALDARVRYGADGAVPWIELEGGPRLHGFATEPENRDIHELLRRHMPARMPATHFRLMKDCVTRFLYPHMRPDLKPDTRDAEALFGFHGQHKDAIADLDDAAARAALMAAFAPKAGECIVDCGAFLGFGDLRLAPDVAPGRIVAIEANRGCFELLQRNLAHNKATNVTALHNAVWSGEGELELESTYAQGNSLLAEVQEGTRKEKVRTISVDMAVAAHGLSRVDMLSLTLNGAEPEALDGAARTLRELRPRVRLAGWYTRGGEKIWSLAKPRLEAHGYRVFVGRRSNVMALPAERCPS